MKAIIMMAIAVLSVVAITPAFAGAIDMAPDFVRENYKNAPTNFSYDSIEASVEILSNWSLDTAFSGNSFVPADMEMKTLTMTTSPVPGQKATFGISNAYIVATSYGDIGTVQAFVNGKSAGFLGFDQNAMRYSPPSTETNISIIFHDGCLVTFEGNADDTFASGKIKDCDSKQTPFLKGTTKGLVASDIFQTTS